MRWAFQGGLTPPSINDAEKSLIKTIGEARRNSLTYHQSEAELKNHC